MKLAAAAVAVALALTLDATLARYSLEQGPIADLVLVVVVGVAITAGPARGLLTGSLGGLAQDALSGGILGVGGLAKTTVGFLAGVTAQRLVIGGPLPRFVVFFAATVAQTLCVAVVYALLPNMGGFVLPLRSMVTQAVMNGGIGALTFELLDLVPAAWERRRGRRGRRTEVSRFD